MATPSATFLDSNLTVKFGGLAIRIFSAWAVLVWFVVGIVLNMMWTFFAGAWVFGLGGYLTHFVWGAGLTVILAIEAFQKQRGTWPLVFVMIVLMIAFPFATRPLQLAGDWLGFMARKPGYDRIVEAGQRGELGLTLTGRSKVEGIEYTAIHNPHFIAAFHIYHGIPDGGAAIVFDPEETLADPEAPEKASLREPLQGLLGGDGVRCMRYAPKYYRCGYS